MYSNIRHFTKYVRHRIASSREISGVQYQSVNDLFADFINKKNPAGYDKIWLLHRELGGDKDLLHVKDLGAGSSSGNTNIRQAGKFIRISSVSKNTGRFLSCLTHSLNPAFIIELGTGAGISTMYMAIACPLSRIFSIEGSPDIADFAVKNLNRAGIRNVKIIIGSFSDKLPEVLLQIQHPLFVFIDGDHRGVHLIEYFKTILAVASENTVIVLDDIKWSETMEQSWEYIISHKEVSVSIDLYRMGVLILKKDVDKHHFRVRI